MVGRHGMIGHHSLHGFLERTGLREGMEQAFEALHIEALSSHDDSTKVLLHGVLEITVETLNFRDIINSLWADINDMRGGCFVTAHLPNVRLGRTTAQQNHHGKVVWQEKLRYYTAHPGATLLTFNLHGHGYKGEFQLPAADILAKRHVDTVLPVFNRHHECSLHVVVDFFPADEHPLWGIGLGDPLTFEGVPRVHFPHRKGCLVIPYQNSHVEDHFRPPITLSSGQYRPGRYWEELHKAIHEAKHFIYIAGWSLYAQIALIRDSADARMQETVETLLIRRANEGLSVLIMVWDDKTNNLDGLLLKEGMMKTHDEDTHNSFVNTKVKVFRCPRNPVDVAFALLDGFAFTHHQKAVVMDAPVVDPSSGDNRRRLIAFVGGIDLCGGRYDTPTHSLFRTLNTVHKNDFHTESLPGADITKGGPRQPWHDCHSKVEGAVAWDVHENFVHRWTFQREKDHASLLVNVKNAEIFIPPSPVVGENNSSAWNVQLFRSIDSSSLHIAPDPETVLKAGLVRDSVQIVDQSIQDAYVCAIRRAKNFIYIQNQYFMGSSFAWSNDMGWAPCIPNLIPIELALKIASKIRAGERFAVYIVIPMAPNGDPVSTAVQDLLHHQRKTMQMMYRIIRQSLDEQGKFQNHPTDFLQFFCLGNREAMEEGEYEPPERPLPGTHYARAQENRRFPIYVHAKVMIVDDEYLIIGSANINQRAMDGARDTEIAIGAYQPAFTLSNADYLMVPSGVVHAFRMSLWYEHLGHLDALYKQPSDQACMKKVQKCASENWIDYIRPGPPADLKGHILPYPIKVPRNGHKIYTEPGDELFPDTQAKILGSLIAVLPALLTA